MIWKTKKSEILITNKNLNYFFMCRKNAKSKNPKVVRIEKGRIIILWKCSVCNSRKSEITKEKKAGGLLRSSGTPLRQIPLFGPLLF